MVSIILEILTVFFHMTTFFAEVKRIFHDHPFFISRKNSFKYFPWSRISWRGAGSAISAHRRVDVSGDLFFSLDRRLYEVRLEIGVDSCLPEQDLALKLDISEGARLHHSMKGLMGYLEIIHDILFCHEIVPPARFLHKAPLVFHPILTIWASKIKKIV